MAVTLGASASVDFGTVYDVPQTGAHGRHHRQGVERSRWAHRDEVGQRRDDRTIIQLAMLRQRTTPLGHQAIRIDAEHPTDGDRRRRRRDAAPDRRAVYRKRDAGNLGRWGASLDDDVLLRWLPATASGASQGEVQVGFETDESINGLAADYAELAVWLEAVPDWVILGYGKGMSPRYYRSNGALYCPLVHTGYLVNEWAATGGTNSSGTNGVHPAMYYPG